MSKVEITPALLADIEQKAKAANPAEINEPVFYASQATGCYPEPCDLYFWTHDNPPEEIGQIYSQRFSDYYAAANPAVVLAMIAQITFLQTLLFSDMLPHDDPIFRAEELDKEVKELRAEVERLRAAQCWAIVTIETGVFDGPYATFEAAENERLAELCDDPDEPMYRVEPWRGPNVAG